MIFSKQKMETAFTYQSAYYNKILLVNLWNDSYQPIRVEDSEWNVLQKCCSFTDWVKSFIESDSYKPCDDGNRDNLSILLDLEECSKLNNVFICNYYKLIDGEYHVVQLELYPDTDGFAYLFVRDLTMMQRGIMPGKE